MINLTDGEKIKFIEYLKQEANISKQLVAQMEKMPNQGWEVIIKRENNKILAYLFVAIDLESYETEIIK